MEAVFISKHIRNLLDNNGPPTEPSAKEAFAAVVMADISGYSALSSHLSERGPMGGELLLRTIKRAMDMVKMFKKVSIQPV